MLIGGYHPLYVNLIHRNVTQVYILGLHLNFGTVMQSAVGKYYDENEYYIECGNALLPSRLIVLNGGYYGIYNDNFPAVQSDADDVFDVMYQNSQEQKSKYFN